MLSNHVKLNFPSYYLLNQWTTKEKEEFNGNDFNFLRQIIQILLQDEDSRFTSFYVIQINLWIKNEDPKNLGRFENRFKSPRNLNDPHYFRLIKKIGQVWVGRRTFVESRYRTNCSKKCDLSPMYIC